MALQRTASVTCVHAVHAANASSYKGMCHSDSTG